MMFLKLFGLLLILGGPSATPPNPWVPCQGFLKVHPGYTFDEKTGRLQYVLESTAEQTIVDIFVNADLRSPQTKEFIAIREDLTRRIEPGEKIEKDVNIYPGARPYTPKGHVFTATLRLDSCHWPD